MRAADAPPWIDEGGTGGDLSDIYIRCGVTGLRRPLADAKLPESRVLGLRRGHRPWLGRNAQETCRAEDSHEPASWSGYHDSSAPEDSARSGTG